MRKPAAPAWDGGKGIVCKSMSTIPDNRRYQYTSPSRSRSRLENRRFLIILERQGILSRGIDLSLVRPFNTAIQRERVGRRAQTAHLRSRPMGSGGAQRHPRGPAQDAHRRAPYRFFRQR